MKLFLLLTLILEVSAWAGGNIPLIFMPGHQTSLIFTTATQSVYATDCSGAVTVQNISGSTPMNLPSGLTINLTGSSGMTFYSDGNCTTPTTTATIAAAANSTTYYFVDTTTGAAQITMDATGYKTVIQSETVSTNPFIWTGNAGDNVWSTPGNWSSGTAPSSTQVALFDGTSCSTFCSPHITSSLSVGGVRTLSAYAGTITQNSGKTITINSAGWIQMGGNFVGSSTGDAFKIASTVSSGWTTSNFYLSSGSFIATSGTTSLGASFTGSKWTITGSPTFNHNNGALAFISAWNGSPNTIVPGTSSYYDVIIGNSQNTTTLSNTMTVAHNLTIGGDATHTDAMLGGQINLAGNLYVVGEGVASVSAGGATIINLNGTSSQSVDATGATVGYVPTLNISSTGGAVSLLGNPCVYGDYKFNSGTINPGTSTLTLGNPFGGSTYTFANETYNNLAFWGQNVSMAVNGTASVSGQLAFNGTSGSLALNGGTINAMGDVIATGVGGKGSMQVNVVGTSSQKIDTTASTTGNVPRITIASTGGSVSLFGTINYTNNWIVNSGSIAAGTSTVGGGGAFGTFTPGTGVTYNNVNFLGSSGAVTTITGNLTASGNISMGSGTYAVMVQMPNPGTGYTLSTGGTLTVNALTTLNLHGATRTQAATVNNGTINP